MSTPLRLRPDGLPTGPQDPVAGPPVRRPGSIRRTTSIDVRRGEPGEDQHLIGVGRDLETRPDGSTEVRAAARVEAIVDAAGKVVAIVCDPPVPALAALVGGSVSKGLRARADALLPDHASAATVLHQLLDDFPMAALISHYGASREDPGFTMSPEAADGMTDLCAGWRRGGTMLGGLQHTGLFPIPLGPVAPALPDPGDPLGWHELPELLPRSIRRCRRIDVTVPPGGRVADVHVHYRDSHLGPEVEGTTEPEDVLHEYTLAVTVDAREPVVLSASAVARVLPWPECPGALASAGRVVGEPVSRLRSLVGTRFTGTSTCTHLNDSLRSLAGVEPLLSALRP